MTGTCEKRKLGPQGASWQEGFKNVLGGKKISEPDQGGIAEGEKNVLKTGKGIT